MSARTLLPALGALLLASGCAGLSTTPPAPAAAAVDAERAALLTRAIDTHLDHAARVDRLAWPLLRENADLCGARTTEKLGVRVATAETLSHDFRGLRASDARAAGWPDSPRVLGAIAGAPADGVFQRGDRILAINGTDVRDADLKALQKALAKAVKPDTPIRFTIAHPGGETAEAALTPVKICDFGVAYQTSTTMNASTDGKAITILGGLEARTNDAQLGFTIAHELAHAILRHPRKNMRNAIVSGGAVYGALAAGFGAAADALLGLVDDKPSPPLAARGLALMTPGAADFEREADYLGVYLLARAHLPLDGIEGVFETFTEESPLGAWAELTHPVSPERLLAVRAAVAEVRAKQASGAPLSPKGWDAPEQP